MIEKQVINKLVESGRRLKNVLIGGHFPASRFINGYAITYQFSFLLCLPFFTSCFRLGLLSTIARTHTLLSFFTIHVFKQLSHKIKSSRLFNAFVLKKSQDQIKYQTIFQRPPRMKFIVI